MAPLQWEELDGSPTEGLDSDGRFAATMRLKCNWSERISVARFFVENRFAYPHLSEKLDRDTHGVNATESSSAPFRARESQTTYRGIGMAAYQFAIVTIKFGTPRPGQEKYQINATDLRGRAMGLDRGRSLISENIESTAESRILPADRFVWKSDESPLSEQEAPARIEFGHVYVFTRHETTYFPPEALELHGHVNREELATLTPLLHGKIYAPETLRYDGVSESRTVDFDGSEKVNTISRFSYKPTGWNTFWRADLIVTDPLKPGESTRGGYDRIAHKRGLGPHVNEFPDDYNNYPLGDLLVL